MKVRRELELEATNIIGTLNAASKGSLQRSEGTRIHLNSFLLVLCFMLSGHF